MTSNSIPKDEENNINNMNFLSNFDDIRNSLNVIRTTYFIYLFYEFYFIYKNNLAKGDYLRALDKISDNLTNIRNNMKELRNYQITIGTKKDTKTLIDQSNQVLSNTGEIFKETIILIKDFKDYKFPNKNDQVANLRQLRLMESKCSDMKNEFDSITKKIQRQNMSVVESNRNSRISIPSTFDDNKMQIVMGNELLSEERLIEKENQNKTIEK